MPLCRNDAWFSSPGFLLTFRISRHEQVLVKAEWLQLKERIQIAGVFFIMPFADATQIFSSDISKSLAEGLQNDDADGDQ
jgi:hypothetical protein